MEIQDSESQFQNNPIILPEGRDFFVIVGANNSGKSTILRAITKNDRKGSSYLVNVNRTVLTGEGAIRKDYQENYLNRINRAIARSNDNYQRETEPLQDFFNLSDEERKTIIDWYNKYFPNQLLEERENPNNSASPMFLKTNGFSITDQGSGIRATFEIFIKLFDSRIKVLCIDEPEIGLEPQLQKYLFVALKERASSNKKIVLATHSHHFLDFNSADNNYVCQRDSNNKIFLTQVEDLKPVIFRLLGNTLSSFLLPENILVLEGSSDTTFLNRCLSLLSKNNISIHNSGGNGNLSYAINSITQFLRFHDTSLPIYKDKIFVIADKPTKDTIIREWEKILSNKQRLKVLSKDAIEYYYPHRVLKEIFNTSDNLDDIVVKYLKNYPNGFNDIQISKTQLAMAVSEKITTEDLNDELNELFVFLKTLP